MNRYKQVTGGAPDRKLNACFVELTFERYGMYLKELLPNAHNKYFENKWHRSNEEFNIKDISCSLTIRWSQKSTMQIMKIVVD